MTDEPAANQTEPAANQPEAAGAPPPEPVAPEPEAAVPQPELAAAFGEASDPAPVVTAPESQPTVPAPESQPAVPGPDPGPAVPWEQPTGAALPTSEPGPPGAEPPLEAGTLWQPIGKPRGRGKRIAVAAIAVIAVLVVVAYIGSAINRAQSDFASTFYGGVYQKLSEPDRKALSARFDKALGSELDGMSQQQIQTHVAGLVKNGLPRLDDAALVRHLRLQTQALDAASEADCGAFARASLAGQPVANETGGRVIVNLDGQRLAEWISLQADAIEAELASSPPPRRVTDADVQTTLRSIFGGMDQPTIDTIVAANDHPATASDAEVCAAVRAIYDRGVTLTTPDLELLARYDVS